MGNFMVLNLFLALLLNSFNSEELKSKKEVNILSLYKHKYFASKYLIKSQKRKVTDKERKSFWTAFDVISFEFFAIGN